MRSYFFNFGDYHPIRDVEGTELPDDAAAIDNAAQALTLIARDEIAEPEERRKISVSVTDDAGHCIYAASITFEGVCLR